MQQAVDERGVDERGWVPAIDGYELALDGARLVCRNAKGRLLKSPPKRVRESAPARDMMAVRDWLVRHEAECRETVESWMLGSFPVPARIIAEVWPDPAWRTALENLVVVTGNGPGLLRGVDGEGRIGLVDLDAETHWLAGTTLAIPHPVLLDDLGDLRDFAAELGVEQQVPQLTREVFHKPADVDADAREVRTYAGGTFKELRHATSRAGTFGFRVRGGYATCHAFDEQAEVQARYWLGADAPEFEAWTGDLVWVDARERPLRAGDVGPVAWSEGIRMAELIYAGRVVEEGEA